MVYATNPVIFGLFEWWICSRWCVFPQWVEFSITGCTVFIQSGGKDQTKLVTQFKGINLQNKKALISPNESSFLTNSKTLTKLLNSPAHGLALASYLVDLGLIPTEFDQKT